jgi:glycosyltransferase involved in cell wall biosynthesis
MKNSLPLFSIIIPTLNEEKYLPLLLKDLTRQTFTSFEVIHVDGNSEDRTQEKAVAYASLLPLETISVSKRNVSYQRNMGAKQARGKWLIFMDADNRLRKNFLSLLNQELQENPFTDVFTCMWAISSPRALEKHVITLFNLALKLSARVKPFAGGAMIGTKRAVFRKVKFNTRMKMSEDHQFVQDAVKLGFRFEVLARPYFYVSLRRFEKDGVFKVASIYAQCMIHQFTGDIVIKELPEYPMGGSLYKEKAKKTSSGNFFKFR